MDSNWRAQITAEERQKLIKKIVDTLQTRMAASNQSNQSNVNDLFKIACHFEEMVFQAAADQQDYFRRITSKLITLERSSNATGDGSLPTRPVTAVPSGTNQMDLTTGLMQQQLLNPGQSMGSGISMLTHGQQASSQSLTGNMIPNALQASTGLGSSISNMAGAAQSSLNNISGQSSIASFSTPQSMLLTNSQRLQQLQQGRQQQQQQQQQQKVQQQLVYQQQLQQSYMLKHNMKQPQQPFHQQQQQPLLQQQQQQQPFLQQQTQPQLLDQLNSVQALQQQQLLQQRLQHLQQQSSQQQQPVQQQQQPLQQQHQVLQLEAMGKQQQQGQPQGGNLMLQQQTLSQSQFQHKHQGSSSDPSASVKPEPSALHEEQDVVVLKLGALKDQYYPQLKELHALLSTKAQQSLPADQLTKLKHYKDLLQRIIPYLTVTKENIPKDLNQVRVDALEKHVIQLMEILKRTRAPAQQQGSQDQQQAQQKQQQLKEHEQKLKSGDQQAVSPQQQQQTVSQIQQPEKHMHHLLGQASESAMKLTDAAGMQGQMVSTLQRGAASGVQSGRLNVPQPGAVADLQMKTPNMLQSVVGNAMPQTPSIQMQQPFSQMDRTQQQRFLKEREQLQQHKFNEQVALNQLQKGRQLVQHFQQGQDVKGDLKAKQTELQQVLFQQQQHLKQRQLLQQQQQAFRVGSPQMVSSPQLVQDNLPLASLQKPNDNNPINLTQQNIKVGISTQALPMIRLSSASLQSVNSPQEVDSRINKSVIPVSAAPGSAEYPEPTMVVSAGISESEVFPSPFTGMSPMAAQPLATEDRQQHVPTESPVLDTLSGGELPLQQLINKIDAVSSRALRSAVEDIFSVVSCSEIHAAPAPDINSKAAGGEDLALTTRNRMQTSLMNEGSNSTKRKLRHYDSVPLSLVLEDGNVTNDMAGTSWLESLGCGSVRTPAMKKHTIEVCPSLKREIYEINQQLVESHVDIDESGTEEAAADGKEGILVSCTFVGSNSNQTGSFWSQTSSLMFLPPLRLLIPPSYPFSSPIIESQFSIYGSHPAAYNAREEFVRSARCLSQPVSLEALAKAWDLCARNAIMDMAASVGGGSFSSAIGAWQSCTTT